MNTIRPAIVMFILMTVLTGVLYPIAVTGLAQGLFPQQANGSIVMANGQPVGSGLIGQQFMSPAYFWSRPSATGPFPNNAAASSGSNFGPLNPALGAQVQARIDALQRTSPASDLAIPVDLVTASASGLDPDISLAAAYYQAARVAAARSITVEAVRSLIDQRAKRPWLGVIGEPRINVLALNLALDGR